MKSSRLIVPTLLLLLTSCQSIPKKARDDKIKITAPPPPASWQMSVAGEIERVNPEHGYVIVKCTVLPSTDEEATVYRSNQRVGSVRFTGPARPPYIAADILEGRLQRGDRVRE